MSKDQYIEHLEELVNTVKFSTTELYCQSVYGLNWFDVRNEIIAGGFDAEEEEEVSLDAVEITGRTQEEADAHQASLLKEARRVIALFGGRKDKS